MNDLEIIMRILTLILVSFMPIFSAFGHVAAWHSHHDWHHAGSEVAQHTMGWHHAVGWRESGHHVLMMPIGLLLGIAVLALAVYGAYKLAQSWAHGNGSNNGRA